MLLAFGLLVFLFDYVLLALASPARILVFSRTVGFRHDSIPTAINALRSRASSINVMFDDIEDQGQFETITLRRYDAVVFLSTTGEVLDAQGKEAFQSYLSDGGNFIAIHSASDSLLNTTFYGREVGAYFDYHAELQNATVNVIDTSHPSTAKLPAEWKVVDEMYNFKSDPRSLGAIVVLAANESSYVDNGMRKFDQGSPHPLAWYQEHGAGVSEGNTPGRSFYTSLGHLNETWQDDLFMSHILGGISWTLQSNTTRAFNASALVGNGDDQSPSPTENETSTGPTSSVAPEVSKASKRHEYLVSGWEFVLGLSMLLLQHIN